MKIIKHDAVKRPGMMFTDVIEFKIPVATLGTIDLTLNDLNQICGWIANTFSENYVIMEILDRRISGGWGDHAKESWEDAGSTVDRSEEPYVSHYELRCYSKDATLFLLRWS